MAEALFKNLIQERDDLNEEISVSSAGVYAYEGDPASTEARKTMKEEFGVDISAHRAKVLDDRDIRESYLVLTMTAHHRKMILEIYPEAADKVYTLKNFAQAEGESPDVCDPFGQDYETYKDCACEIEALLLDILDKIE